MYKILHKQVPSLIIPGVNIHISSYCAPLFSLHIYHRSAPPSSVVPVSGAVTPLPLPTPPPPDTASHSVKVAHFALYSTHNITMSCCSLCLQTLWKFSTTDWMHGGGTLVPTCVWIQKSWTSLNQVNGANQKTAC